MSTDLTDVVSLFAYTRQAGQDQATSSVEAMITKAIGAHGSHQEDVTTVAQDTQCDFGRWLHSSNPAASDQAHHQAAKALHATFHKEAASTLRLVSAGNQVQAQASIAAGGSFAEAARLLTKTMIDWRQATA
jgi:hypothetical protein